MENLQIIVENYNLIYHFIYHYKLLIFISTQKEYIIKEIKLS